MKRLFSRYQLTLNKPLSHYKVYSKNQGINKQVYVLLGLFVLAWIWFILENLTLVNTTVWDWRFIVVASFILGVLPLVYLHVATTHHVVLTKEAVGKQTFFRGFKIIPYDTVKDVKHTKRNVLKIKGEEASIVFRLDNYDKEMEAIKTLLEYRGFLNHPEIPYDLYIGNDTVRIEQQVEEMDIETEGLIEQYRKSYQYLTPGYIEDVLFYNVQIEKVQLTQGKHIVFLCTHVDIKPDHPENTHYAAQKTDSAIVVFQDVDNVEIFNIEVKKDASDVVLLGTNMNALRKVAKRAVMFDTTIKRVNGRYEMDAVMSQDVKKQRVRFSFKNGIVGWNQLIEDAWFENKAK